MTTPLHRAQCAPWLQGIMFPRHSNESFALRGYKGPRFHATPPNELPSADTRDHVSTPLHWTHCSPRIQGNTFPRFSTVLIALRGCKETRFHATPPSELPSADKRTMFPRHSTESIAPRRYKEPRFHATPRSALPSVVTRNQVSSPFHRAHCPSRIQRNTFPLHSTERIALRGYKETRFHATPPCSLPSADTRKHVSTPLHRANCPPWILETRFHVNPPNALPSADTREHVSTPYP